MKSGAAAAGRELQGDLRKRARRTALRFAARVAGRALRTGSRAALRAASRVGERGIDSALERAHRLPIQRSIDVAVPVEVAWEQWMELRHLPEGGHRLADVERDGDQLVGRLEGIREREWSAEVIDERDEESFAWRSSEGSDTAGLVTFHELGERLTRIELDLDVRPEDVADAALLMLHVADRRVEAELRRFKADAEFLNPDIYEELLDSHSNGDSPREEDG